MTKSKSPKLNKSFPIVKPSKNPIVADWKPNRPKDSRQVVHNLRRRMGR